MRRLIVIGILSLATCGAARPAPIAVAQAKWQTLKQWLMPRLSERMARLRARNKYRLRKWLPASAARHAYEVYGRTWLTARLSGRKWFTSSLSGDFAASRSGEVHGMTRSTFGKFSALSDLGSGLKYEVNQDGYVLFQTSKRSVLAVFDGISTGGDAEIATAVAINTLRDALPNNNLVTAFEQVRHNLQAHARANPCVSKNYGVCAAGADIFGNTAIVSHVGDVRLLLVRNGEVYGKTHDHNPTWQQVMRGSMTPEQYVQDDVDKSLVSRALRIPRAGDVDESTVEVKFMHLDPGDTLIIASDAVWNLLTNAEVAQLTQDRTTEEAVAAIREAVRDRVGDHTQRDDNFTIIIYHHDPEGLR